MQIDAVQLDGTFFVMNRMFRRRFQGQMICTARGVMHRHTTRLHCLWIGVFHYFVRTLNQCFFPWNLCRAATRNACTAHTIGQNFVYTQHFWYSPCVICCTYTIHDFCVRVRVCMCVYVCVRVRVKGCVGSPLVRNTHQRGTS
jgi:hypothetical protein